MTLQLKVTAKGQITLKQALLSYIGVKPGETVEVIELPDGGVELRRPSKRRSIMDAAGMLHRPGQKAATLEEMQEAIESVEGV